MSYFVAGAVVVGAVGNAVSSNKASKENAKGVQKGLDQSAALAMQARQDAIKLFERSSQNSALGLKGAFDFYKTAAPSRMQPYLQASRQAQNVIGQGATQANNAILGLPVDMSFTQQQPIQPSNNYLLGAELPEYSGGFTEDLAIPEPEPQAAKKKESKADSIKRKLDSGDLGKSILKKLF